MDIFTVCKPDAWLDTQLLRWRWSLYRRMPDAVCHLLIPYGLTAASADVDAATRRLARHFGVILPVREQREPGFSLFTDLLRAAGPKLMGLREALYLDADADAVDDLSPIPAASDAGVLWTPNAVIRDSVAAALRTFGLDPAPPYVEPAVLYLRQDMTDAYLDVVNCGRLDLFAYLPGVNAWNVAIRRCGSHAMLPARYNVMYQRMFVEPDPAVIHFCSAKGKTDRLRLGLDKWPLLIEQYLNGAAQKLPVTWEDPPDAWREASGETQQYHA